MQATIDKDAGDGDRHRARRCKGHCISRSPIPTAPASCIGRHYPATKPTGADEATLIKWDLNTQKAQLDSLEEGFKLNGGKLWGNVDPAPSIA